MGSSTAIVRFVRRLFVVCLAFLGAVTALGQDVTLHGDPSSAGDAQLSKRAENLQFYSWPALFSGDQGTQIRIEYGYHVTLVRLLVNPPPSPKKMQSLGDQIASTLGALNSTIDVWNGREVSEVDVQLSRFQILSWAKRRLVIDLDSLNRMLLQHKELQKPIVGTFATAGADDVRFGDGETRIEADREFFKFGSKLQLGKLQFTAEVTPYTYFALLVAVVLYGLATWALATLPWILERDRRRLFLNEDNLEQLKSPEIVQSTYRELPKRKPSETLWMVLIVGIGISMVKQMDNFPRIVPLSLHFPIAVLAFSVLPASYLISWSIFKATERKRWERDYILEKASKRPDHRFKPLGILIACLALPPLVFAAASPAVHLLPKPARLTCLTIELLVTLGAWGYGLLQLVQVSRKRLKLGDSIFDQVARLAAIAEVRVGIVEIRDKQTQALLSDLLHNLSLSAKFEKVFTERQQTALLAREIGRIKLHHSLRQGIIPTVCVCSAVAVMFGMGTLLDQRWLIAALPIGAGVPLLIIASGFIQPTEKIRLLVLEADKYAAELTGDIESVIEAISKLNHLEQKPSELSEKDEKRSPVPSLHRRIAALQAVKTEISSPEGTVPTTS